MKTINLQLFSRLLLFSLLLLPLPAFADPGNQYCITPPFITSGVKPNILLMIDNSSSMYDMAYSDQGEKSGATITRQPFYCYDETYKSNYCSNNSSRTCTSNAACSYCSGDTSSTCRSSADCGGAECVTAPTCLNLYSGYFDPGSFYDYDFTNLYFVKVNTLPSGSDCEKSVANRLCVKFDHSVVPNTLTRLAGYGNYLNWLTASKFDVEKRVLTGGKYVTKVCKDDQAKPCTADSDCVSPATCGTVEGLQPESRGCLGQGFIKDALTGDFVNFADGVGDPNTQLGVTFAIRGPFDSANRSAPSRGGQTFIEVYNGKYNAANCEDAVKVWGSSTASQTDVRDAVELCLNYNPSTTSPNYCSGNPSLGCTIDANCVFPGNPAVSGGCSNNASIPCTSNPVCGSTTGAGTCDNVARSCTASSDCTVSTAGTCSNQSLSCAGSADCTIPEVPGTCSNKPLIACRQATVSSDCYKAEVMGTCSTGTGRTCRADGDCPLVQGHCSIKHGNVYDACTTNADCGTGADPTKYGTCSNPANVAAGSCSGYAVANTGTCSGTAGSTGTCDGGAIVSTGSCAGMTTTANSCNNPPPIPSTTLNYGPCVNPTQSTVVKTKVTYSHTIQTCWSYFRNGAFSNGDFNRLTSKCDDVYAGWGICSADNSKTCAEDTDCSASGLGTCQHGPTAIRPGNPALACSQTYVGQFCNGFTWDSATHTGRCGSWDGESATTDAVFAQFCDSTQPTVIDPTDSATSNPNYEATPAIISGTGVWAQLGSPLGTVPVKIALSPPACSSDSDCSSGTNCSGGTCKPIGLIQEFSSQIRTGAMTFNEFGSVSEAASTSLIKVPKVCSNDHKRLCNIDRDCVDFAPGVGSGTCAAAAGTDNMDGGKIIYPIGRGKCADMTATPCLNDTGCTSPARCFKGFCGTPTTTVCTTDQNCGAGTQICATDSAGEHTAADSLVNVIDTIRANAWTPFAEAFYNIIGYFAQIPVGLTNAGKSRADLKINAVNATSYDFTGITPPPIDFNVNLNPSEYRCQQNYVLLISDGASTADQRPAVSSLASLYATGAGLTAGTCPNYMGSKNLPIMTWIAKHQNIGTFSAVSPATPLICSGNGAACTVDTDCPAGQTCLNSPHNPRDFITTYVVYNGGDNGQTGDCSSKTLLTNAAAKGGTTLQMAENPAELNDKLRKVFEDVAAKAASGTAASILSNSEGSGANILQAVFYPKKIFENSSSVNWIGEMQNLWYFVDPMISNSTIHEDSDADRRLNLVNDYIVRFAFDNSLDKTMVQRYQDVNGDGAADTTIGGLIDPDDVKSIWRAGRLLWARDLSTSPRNIKTTVDGSSLINFSIAGFPGVDTSAKTTRAAAYLNVAEADVPNLVSWVRGNEVSGYRQRTVEIKNASGVGVNGIWRLGDIISSTPRVQSTVRLNTYNLSPPGGYSDASYLSYITSNDYKSRGMVYVGANDGMLHAFNLGILDVTASGNQKATLYEVNPVGTEEWAFIPRNALPYLRYNADPEYGHLYYVDGRTVIFDASIGDTAGATATDCVASTYWKCPKGVGGSVVNGSNALDANKNTWRSIVIGGMGIGGASTKTCTAGSSCVQTPLADPDDSSKGLGYSSYFALDITDPVNPSLLWEFGHPDLGYSTSGPAIIRLGADPLRNGRWFAVFGSGPTGPIDIGTHQFQASSNQPLKFFVVDLRTGALVQTITTGIDNAFSGSMLGASIDIDRWNTGDVGNYQDDAFYVGYVKTTALGVPTLGGVGRVVIDPLNVGVEPTDVNVASVWHWLPLTSDTDNIGPVTTAISRLQDRKNRNLWLYFGSGRYYYRAGSILDDYGGNRSLFGIKDPCYNTAAHPGNVIDRTCNAAISGTVQDQTSTIHTIAAGDAGWRINLDPSTTAEGAERVVTDTVALTNGTVFFTSFKPTTDICGYGGNSFLWGVKYDTGGQAAGNALQGKALIQLSTGEFKEVDLSTAFNDPATLNRRMQTPMTGKPPSDAPPIISNSSNKPIKKILHIQER